MNQDQLRGHVAEAAERLGVAGVAVGVHHAGRQHYAFHGVTSLESPVPVDATTLFQLASTGKTMTATALMCLVDRGLVDLDERVRTYVPELRLKDEDVAREVTVLNLLNHTAGWQGDLEIDTGNGDDALARYVELMAGFEQETALDETVSYNNASFSLAGLVIEKVTGQTFERAIETMLFEPLGMEDSYFFNNDIMTRRFVVGHFQDEDGTLSVARPWALTRGGNPAGGSTHTARDLLTWGRFHLGDGRAEGGARVLSHELLERMQRPTVETPGNELGDAIGIGWRLRDVHGVGLVYHGGSANGQLSAFLLVPEHDFAITSTTNSEPNGDEFNGELVRWALEQYLGVIDRIPEPIRLSPSELAPYTGRFETVAVTADISVDDGGLLITASVKNEARKDESAPDDDSPRALPPLPLGLLPGEGDRYIVTGGPSKGLKGYFVRDESGNVKGLHIGGRLATRTGAASP